MKLSRELPRSKPRRKLPKAAARAINLAQKYDWLHSSFNYFFAINNLLNSFYYSFGTKHIYSRHASQNPTQGVPRCHLQRMRMTAEVRKRKRKIMKIHCVVLVVTTTDRMSSGYAVMPVRLGSMASVSRSLLPRPSTSSTTSVRTAAVVARERGHDPAGYIHLAWRTKNLTL